jgi:glycerol-3-phosphate acyltransferase PlsY
MREPLAILISYVIGCFPTGFLFVKIKIKKDIRTLKGGSTGARNVGRVLGTRWSLATFVLDTLKGVLALSISRYLEVVEWALVASILAVVVGHIWPPQLRFKGGKGLSPALGAGLVLDFRVVVGFFLVTVAAFLFTKKVEASVMVGLVFLPSIIYVLNYSVVMIVGMSLLACLVLYMHREHMAEYFWWNS